MRDNNEKKLTDFAKLAKKFIKCANDLLYASEQVGKWDGGTPARNRAVVKFDRISAQYDTLQERLEAFANFILD